MLLLIIFKFIFLNLIIFKLFINFLLKLAYSSFKCLSNPAKNVIIFLIHKKSKLNMSISKFIIFLIYFKFYFLILIFIVKIRMI